VTTKMTGDYEEHCGDYENHCGDNEMIGDCENCCGIGCDAVKCRG
jgi:hypothetical protein